MIRINSSSVGAKLFKLTKTITNTEASQKDLTMFNE